MSTDEPSVTWRLAMAASCQHIERGTYDERVAEAHRLKEAGNALLNSGDFEEALETYVQGLWQAEFHERALAMVPTAIDDVNAVRVPLLLNAVLCELRMNPEEQQCRLATAEARQRGARRAAAKREGAISARAAPGPRRRVRRG